MSDPNKLPIETPLEWLHFAEGDFRVAEREGQTETPVFPTLCFLCQSAAEKFLKAYLISRGWPLEKTHDILELIGLCKNYSADLTDLESEAATLNDYIIAGRYPGDTPSKDIGKAEAEEALKAARAIRDRVVALMAKKEEPKE
ncbi:MAG: HEPN domain-containing protein [Chloroflexota bacterium]